MRSQRTTTGAGCSQTAPGRKAGGRPQKVCLLRSLVSVSCLFATGIYSVLYLAIRLLPIFNIFALTLK